MATVFETANSTNTVNKLQHEFVLHGSNSQAEKATAKIQYEIQYKFNSKVYKVK